MSSPPPSGQALRAVPTLTEVLDWPPAARRLADPVEEVRPDEAELVQRVLAELQPGLQRAAEALLEQRFRDVIEPALERLADALLREVRDELAAALCEVAQRAVEQEVAQHRGP